RSLVTMNNFDKLKFNGRSRRFDWLNGFDVENVPSPDYQSMLKLDENEIAAATDKYMRTYIKTLEDFKRKTSLTALDMGILILAAALQTLRWIFVETIKTVVEKSSSAYKKLMKADNRTKTYEFVPATVEQIADDFSKGLAPYDAANEFTGEALAHNPAAGLIVGTANIATNTLTVNNFSKGLPSYHVVNRQVGDKTNVVNVFKWTSELLLDEPKIVGAAFTRQIFQCGEDFFKTFKLPVPPIKNISSEMSEFLTGEQICEASFAVIINKLVEMCHRIFFNPKTDDKNLYEVRTRKILTYSNTLSSILNVGCSTLTGNVMKLDTGGLLVTLWRILNDGAEIRRIQLEFINKTLNGELRKEEDAINQRLAKWGFSI
ncbi:MAG: hypothetical protein IKN27_12100, partial [Selenomonadaceae bacterium]|nr:hypothetical protein [Selenomonadaceae bacterium]